ncbi:hypothetical protein RUND412_007208 [Rhizina undulata]
MSLAEENVSVLCLPCGDPLQNPCSKDPAAPYDSTNHALVIACQHLIPRENPPAVSPTSITIHTPAPSSFSSSALGVETATMTDTPNPDINSPDPSPRPHKRRRRNIVPDPPTYEEAAEILPAEMVAHLLNRSNAMILKSAGFSGAMPLAQESMRRLAEDYLLSLLRTIESYTLAQRRTRPTVLDFEDMLKAHRISLTDLEGEMKRHPSQAHDTILQPPDPPCPTPPDTKELLGPELDGAKDRRKYLYDHLPPFPSKHTYMFTPVYTSRPTEPQVIRERATDEARLAETALRKLLAVSAASKDSEQTLNGVVGKKRKKRDEAWKRAFEELAVEKAPGKANGVGAGGGGETVLGSVHEKKRKEGEGEKSSEVDERFLELLVNSDSQFWRKGGGNGRRRRSQVEAVAATV